MSSLSDEQCIEAYQAYVAAGNNQVHAARDLGLQRSTFRHRLKRYYERNLGGELPISIAPGQEIKERTEAFDAKGNLRFTSIRVGKESGDVFDPPAGHEVVGISAFTDSEGRTTRKWVKTKQSAVDRETIMSGIKLAIEKLVEPGERAPILPPEHTDPDLLNLHPLPDLHLGLYAWGRQTGTAWDLKTALAVYRKYMQRLIERSPAAKTGVILGGGDLLHADDETKRTRRSGNVLDVDTRYPKVLSEACMLLVYQVDLALAKYEKVIVRILPGNHDEDSAVAVTWFLAAWYRNEERVQVDTDPGEFWFHQHGEVMIAGNHGHNTKVKDMPAIMAARRKEMWGATTFRYAHGFHIHHRHKGADEAGGVIWETHQSPAAQDGYHDSAGYVSGRSLCTITYRADRGETGRSTENIS